MRIVVTGGAGFIGSHIASTLSTAGHEVLVVDDLSTGRRENVPTSAMLEVVDVVDADAIDRIFASFRPEAVSHQAAQTSVPESVRDPGHDARVNVLGTLNVLRTAVTHGVSRFVFASTGGAIYGEVAPATRAKVGTPTRPLSPYGCSKLAAEGYVSAFSAQHGLRSTTLRYANVYGPRQDPLGEAGVVAIFCERLLAGAPIQINAMREPGDGGCIRDYVFVDDVVRANIAAIEGRASGVLDVGTGVETSTTALAGAVAEAVGTPAQIEDAGPRAGDLMRSVLDPAALDELTGTATSLGDGLRATVAWFRGR